jgi:hypothetical protein
VAPSGTCWTKFRTSFRRRTGQSSRRFSHACRHQPAAAGSNGPPAARTRWRSLASRVTLTDHQLVVAGVRLVLAAERVDGRRRPGPPRRWWARCNPRRGSRRRCGPGGQRPPDAGGHRLATGSR